MYGLGHFFHIKEGVTQVDLLAVISYGIVILPLICELCSAHPHATQLWYEGDDGDRVNLWHSR